MVPFFGNVVTDKRNMPDPQKVEIIKEWLSPSNLKKLQSFLGAVNYLSKFIQQLSNLKDYVRRIQSSHGQGSMNMDLSTSKMLFVSPYCFLYYDRDKPMFTEAHATGQGLGAILLQ